MSAGTSTIGATRGPVRQDVYDLLLLHRVKARWVDIEVHLEVLAGAIKLTDYPRGVAGSVCVIS